MEVARKDLKLKIDDFGSHPDVNAAIRSYYRLLNDYMMRRRQRGVIHSPAGYIPLGAEHDESY
jgi:hypothetical protein